MKLIEPYQFKPAQSINPLMRPRKRVAPFLQVVYDLQEMDAGQSVQLVMIGLTEQGVEFPVFTSSPLTPGLYVFNVGPQGSSTSTNWYGPVPEMWAIREVFSDSTGSKAIQRSLCVTEGQNL